MLYMDGDARAPAALMAALAACWLVGVPLARAVRPATPTVAEVACAEGAYAVRTTAATTVARLTLVDDAAATVAPRVDVRRFRRAIGPRVYMGSNGLAPGLAAPPEGTTLSLAFDLRAREVHYAAGPRARDGMRCGRRVTTDARTVLVEE